MKCIDLTVMIGHGALDVRFDQTALFFFFFLLLTDFRVDSRENNPQSGTVLNGRVIK